MATEIELEKTYLLKALPDGIENAKSVTIHDVYIPEEASHAQIRLRHKGDSYVITKKCPISGDDSSRMYEHTIDLTKDEFDALAKNSKKDFIKTRYFMNLCGRSAEVDVYHDKLEGLAVIDFEFDNEQDLNAFQTPDFVQADVTQDETTAGGFLAGKSIDEIAKRLEKYGFKKIGEKHEI